MSWHQSKQANTNTKANNDGKLYNHVDVGGGAAYN
jgi:hypothetical protein